MMNVNVGDRIMLLEDYDEAREGMIGTVKLVRREDVGVEFENAFSGGHTCGGRVASGHGHWIDRRVKLSVLNGNNEDTVKEINELRARLDELEKSLIVDVNTVSVADYTKPNYEDKYWYFEEDGEVSFVRWYDDETDYRLFDAGNVFKSEKAAEKAATRTRVLNMMWQMSSVTAEDIRSDEVQVYVIEYYSDSDTFAVESYGSIRNFGAPHFKTYAEADSALSRFSEDELKAAFLTGV